MSSALLRLSSIAMRRSYCIIDKYLTRSYTSALFIPGNKATKNFAFLSPFLDFDERFADLDKLRKNIELRGLTNIDVDELARTWQFYKYIDADKGALELKRSELALRVKELNKKNSLTPEEEKEKIQLITQGKVFKQNLKIIKEALWDMEENIVVKALQLPNTVHKKTPLDTAIILNSVGHIREPPPNEIKSHLEIGTSLGLIEYKNPMHYYLCDDAALFELGVLSYAGNHLTDGEMTRISGTDFGRSLVLEGSGLDHKDPSKAFVLSNNENVDIETCNRLHLVGGATLVAFLAMHTKQLINPTHLPFKYFATGRQYTPFAEDATENGLFTVCQASAVHTFALVKDPLSDEYMNQFEYILNTVSELYNGLHVHYRTVMRSANELRPWECLRVSYEMWSANSKKYVEVGHISMCGRYFSKRLLIAYQTPTGRDFPAIISGTILSVPKLLGCLLEEKSDKFNIPTKITEHMPGFE